MLLLGSIEWKAVPHSAKERSIVAAELCPGLGSAIFALGVRTRIIACAVLSGLPNPCTSECELWTDGNNKSAITQRMVKTEQSRSIANGIISCF